LNNQLSKINIKLEESELKSKELLARKDNLEEALKTEALEKV